MKEWSNYYELFNVGRLYAERERWAVINDEELDTTDLDFYVSYKGYEGYENAVDRGYVRKIDAVDFVKANFLPEGASLTGESPKCEKVVLLVRKLQDLSQVEVEGDRPDRVLLTLTRVPKKALQYFFDGLEEAIADSAAPLKSFDNLVARLNMEQQRLIFPMGDLTATPPPPA